MFSPEKFAYNIKFHRKRMELTQKELAEMLFLSPQNISKWEKGACTPDIENLCRLAEVLGISIDALVGDGTEQNNEACYLAVDGGGTKTEFLLFTEGGDVVARTVLSASNPNSVSIDGTIGVLSQGIDEMLKYTANIVGMYAGIAGCGNAENRKAVLKVLRKSYPNIKLEISSDIMNVFGSCPEYNNDSIAVISGTGSVVYAKNDTGLHQCGGWGYLFDRAGSGFDIGCDAIRVALAKEDGLIGDNLVSGYVEEELGGGAKQIINQFYSRGRDYIASFSRCVFRAAKENDQTALAIIDRNTERLAKLINFAADKYACRKAIILSGGISNERCFEAALKDKIYRDLKTVRSEIPQVIGAARVCVQNFSKKEIDSLFTDNIVSGYERLIAKKEV